MKSSNLIEVVLEHISVSPLFATADRPASGRAPAMRRDLLARLALAGGFLLAGLSQASAQGAPQVVKFAPGTTAITLKGSIKARGDARYVLDVAAGQVMQALFAASSRDCYFNVAEKGAGTAEHIGSVAGNEFGKNLTAPGAYVFNIYLTRSGARRNRVCRYQLSLELTGPPGGASPGQSDTAMRDACRAAAAPMYGVQPRNVTLRQRINPVPAGGFMINGTVDKGAEGKKTMRCIFRADRTLDRVMATTPDGE